VLELADPLGLSPEQRAQVQAAFDFMKAETSAIGEEVIAGEADLDQLFAGRTVHAREPGRRRCADRHRAGQVAGGAPAPPSRDERPA
jgi:hypothetical protein